MLIRAQGLVEGENVAAAAVTMLQAVPRCCIATELAAPVLLTCIVCCEYKAIHAQPAKLQALLGD
jgi:hypothetical protein